MASAKIAGLLLAAGEAQRFGSDKLTADFLGKPVGAYAASLLAQSVDGPCLAVSVSHKIQYNQLLNQHNYHIILNNSDPKPLSTSLKMGLEALAESDCETVLIMLADMPLVTGEHLADLRSAFEGKPGLIASGYADVRCPPIILPRNMWWEVANASGDQGMRKWLKDAQIVLTSAETLSDIDTVDDLERLSPAR